MRSLIFIITILALAGCVGWFVHYQNTPQKINPYEEYQLVLQTPDPSAQISALLKNIQTIKNIKKWELQGFTYNGKTAQVFLHALGGTATDLISQVQALKMSVNFLQQRAIINFTTEIPGRLLSDKMPNIQQTLKVITERFQTASVIINKTATNSLFTKTDLTINFDHISYEALEEIGSNLANLPVSLTSFSATIENGFLTGNLQLSVLGK